MNPFSRISITLLLILLGALFLRLWGINHEIYTDENKVITPSVILAKGNQTPLLYPKGSYYPHLYHYVLGVAFLPSALMDMPYPGPGTSVDIYTLIARIVTAVIGTATVYVVYRIGKEVRSPQLGLIAAAFLAFLPLHVKYSHYAHVDIPLTCTAALALFASLRLWKTERLKWYAITGILTGVSGAIHYTGFVIGIALVLAHALVVLRNKEYSVRALFPRKLFVALLLIPLSFAIGTPYTFIKWNESVQIYQQLQLRGAAGDLGYTRPDFIWPLYTASPDWGLPFTVSGVWWEFNPLMVTLAALGILFLVLRKNWTLLALLGGTLVIMYIAIIGRLPLYAIKRLLPLAPLFSIFAAWAIDELFRYKKSYSFVPYALAVAGVAVVVLQNIGAGAGFDAAYVGGSSHSTAVAWALANIPHGSTILQHTPIRLLDWNDKNYSFVRMDEVYASFNAKDPEVSHDRAKPLSFFVKEKGVQYIAMDSRIVDRYFDPTSVILFPETTASYQAFYNGIRSQGKLVYKIEPAFWKIAGPRVEIYDVRDIQ